MSHLKVGRGEAWAGQSCTMASCSACTNILPFEAEANLGADPPTGSDSGMRPSFWGGEESIAKEYFPKYCAHSFNVKKSSLTSHLLVGQLISNAVILADLED